MVPIIVRGTILVPRFAHHRPVQRLSARRPTPKACPMAALIAISPRVRRTDTPSRRMRAIGRPDAALATARSGACSGYLLHNADPSADVHDRRKRSTDHSLIALWSGVTAERPRPSRRSTNARTHITARISPTGCRKIAEAVRKLPAESALIDGEAVAFRLDGHSDFAALRTKAGGDRASFVAFERLRQVHSGLRC
jgi:hypothetical protein